MSDQPGSQGNEAQPQRIALPKNIGQTLKYLDDFDLAALRTAVEQEWERRGNGTDKLPVNTPRSASKGAAAPAKTKAGTSKLPVGKVSLIKASARSGMKPAAIAKTLRISLTEVNRVLNAKSG